MTFKRKFAHLAHRRVRRILIIASAEKLKSLFVQANFPRTLWTIQVTNEKNSAIGKHTIRVNALYIKIALKNVTLLSKLKLILVEMFDFTVTQVDNFCKNELITVMFKLFHGKDGSLVFLNRNDNRICLFKCSVISL